MVVGIITLWSIVAVSLVRFLYKKQLKWAAISYGVLYIVLTAWMYFLVVLDVINHGLLDEKWSLWDATVFYDSFIDLNAKMAALSSDWLIAVVFLCMTIALSVVAYLVVSGVQLVQEISRRLRRAVRTATSPVNKTAAHCVPPMRRRIYLTYCRLLS